MISERNSKDGLNRTFMELKRHSTMVAASARYGLNRTFMELKQLKLRKCVQVKVS